jgi:glycosidase
VSNHDLAADRPGTLFAGQPEKLRAQTAWLLLGPGTPFIYYGNEIGQPQGPQRGDTRHRQPLEWEEVQRQWDDPGSIWCWHQRLIHLRHEHASLRRGKARFLKTNLDTTDIAAIWREVDGDATVTLLNGSADAVSELVVTLPAHVERHRGKTAFGNDMLPVQENRALKVRSLAPFESKVFCWERLPH